MHKGPSSINWPIIFGSTKTGLSIFWPDNGLDTGPILLQKEVEVGPDDTLGSIYFNHLFPMGVEAMLEGVDLVRDGRAPKEAQDPDAGTYEGWCRAEDAGVDWTKPAAEVYNLIRGTNPQPGAWTLYGGKRLQIFDSRRVDGGGDGADTDAPGEVTAVDGEGFVVAAGSRGGIRVERVRLAGEAKMGAGEFAAATGLKTGDRFESAGAAE